MADGLRKLHFHDLLWFTIKTKFRIAFLSDETQVKNILRIVYFFFLAGIGLLYGYLFNVILTQSHKPGIEIKAKVVIILTALFVLIIRNYLPTFSSPSNLFSRIYPIKNFHKTVLNISSDLVTSVTIFMAGFFIPFTLMAHHYSIIDVLLLAVISMSVIFIDRGIRLMMEYGFSNNKKLIWGTLVMIALLVAFLTQLYWFYNQAFGLIWAGALFMMIISFGFSMWLEMSLEGTPKTQKIRSIKTDAPSIQMAFRHIYLRNKKFRRMILSLIIKGIFLYEIYLDKNQNSMFIVAFFASFLMSPAVVFSYASNNFFGHFKELWFGSRIYSNDSKMAFKLYLQSLLLPLVIDFAFTMIILAIAIYIGLLTPVWILCYFAQMILFVYLGFVISILKPIKITDRMSSSFRRTTSQLYSSLLLVFVIITGGIMYMHWYWALLFVVPVAAVIHYKAPSFYEANRHKIYSIIF